MSGGSGYFLAQIYLCPEYVAVVLVGRIAVTAKLLMVQLLGDLFKFLARNKIYRCCSVRSSHWLHFCFNFAGWAKYL
jgi:hypothetical protein